MARRKNRKEHQDQQLHPHVRWRGRKPLSVGLLEAGTGTTTTELLGLAAAVVGDEEGAVKGDEGLLEQVLGVLVDELLVVGDQGLGDGLTDGVDLRGVTTAGDADADVDVGELVDADDQEGLVDLRSKVSMTAANGWLSFLCVDVVSVDNENCQIGTAIFQKSSLDTDVADCFRVWVGSGSRYVP